jgi:phosphoribosyl-AMP cyclohydrolase
MLKFDRQGLIPVAIQDDTTNEVLMLAFMNEEAYRLTRETGYTHFYSRSRNTIWRKGEQSGHAQEVRAIFVNCEENSLLIRVKQHGGAACHTGYRSCYYRRILPDGSYETIAERVFDPQAVYGTAGRDASGDGDERATAHPQNNLVNEVGDWGERATARVPAPHPHHPRPYNERGDLGSALESRLRKLYDVYLFLRDRDLSEQSNTSRLLHESMEPASGTAGYLLSRLADEMQELLGVLSGEHVHAGRQQDAILEGSQVGYWLMLLAASHRLRYEDFMPHLAMYDAWSRRRDAVNRVQPMESAIQGGHVASYPSDDADEIIDEAEFIAPEQECLTLLRSNERAAIVRGLQAGFEVVGRACAEAGVSVLDPAEYDLEQMRRKGLVE